MSTTSSQTENKESSLIRIGGTPSPKQKEFFDSRARFTAYGGARGGGKSWALRRKLVAMCLRYEGLRCLLIRRTLPELRSNHVIPFMREYRGIVDYRENERALCFSNGSRIYLGFCGKDRDALRYQGQEYDVIAIDEATQLSEQMFNAFKACLRGTSSFPRRMYLTCNPGGIGHAWVKRLFVDRQYRADERPEDFRFIQALVFDNEALTKNDPDYVISLRSLPGRQRDAWLYGRWDVFEGQFFPEFDTDIHVCDSSVIPKYTKRFVAFDYGFDMLAALVLATDADGRLYVVRELCVSGLTLGEAANAVATFARGEAELAVASPDLWNRRQDSGKSGFEIMQSATGMPPMIPADDRRVAGWRVLRDYLRCENGKPKLLISKECEELIRCLPALICDSVRVEDASSEPHAVTHAPEALRYAVMSRYQAPANNDMGSDLGFIFPQRKKPSLFD